jgi:hypothetical protein
VGIRPPSPMLLRVSRAVPRSLACSRHIKSASASRSPSQLIPSSGSGIVVALKDGILQPRLLERGLVVPQVLGQFLQRLPGYGRGGLRASRWPAMLALQEQSGGNVR